MTLVSVVVIVTSTCEALQYKLNKQLNMLVLLLLLLLQYFV